MASLPGRRRRTPTTVVSGTVPSPLDAAVTVSRWQVLAPTAPPVQVPDPQPPTVTVCITAHQVARWLPETLASVFASTVPPEEVVVCDDGSTDDVAAAVRPWANRITLLRRPQGGEGAAKNTALEHARGDVVVNLDGDDTMHPERLEAVRAVLQQRPDLDVLTSEFDQFGPAAQAPWRLAPRFPVERQREAVLRWNFMPAPAIRRRPLEQVGGYDESLRYGPDWECYARMLLGGSRAGLLVHPLYQYRRWSGQQTADQGRVLHGRVAVLDRLVRLPSLTDEDRLVLSASSARARMDELRWSLRQGSAGRRQALQTLASGPLPVRSRLLAASAVLAPRSTGRLDRGRRA